MSSINLQIFDTLYQRPAKSKIFNPNSTRKKFLIPDPNPKKIFFKPKPDPNLKKYFFFNPKFKKI